MNAVYVVIGSWGDDDNNIEFDHVAVFTNRRAAEADASAYVRANAAGETSRIGRGIWVRHPAMTTDGEYEDSRTAYANVVRRQIEKEKK